MVQTEHLPFYYVPTEVKSPDSILTYDSKPDKKPWKIVIADDEEEVHTMTRMVLRKFTYQDRGVELISAYSGRETMRIMEETPDVAILLLDVVMESEHSGLEVVRNIRETLKNPFVRIILRTGQPGQAPEDDVIRNYDINDYKSKTELTVQKLYTALIASLRAYIDMRTIERNRHGLEKILKQSRQIFQTKDLGAFMNLTLDNYEQIFSIASDAGPLTIDGFGAVLNNHKFQISSLKGNYRIGREQVIKKIASEEFHGLMTAAYRTENLLMADRHFLGIIPVSGGIQNIIYFESGIPFTDEVRSMFEILTSNVSIALENIYLNREIIDTQKEVLYTLGEIVEFRSKETANHVTRVAEYSYMLALEYGLATDEAELLRMASPMHDIGKIGIPDTILNKPAKLTVEEFEVIKTHTTIGYEILKQSRREIMKTAARVALEHHERWDGSGYPYGKKNDEIHIMSRITMLADVYDALSHKRVYKEAWSDSDVNEEIQKQSGIMFEPRLVEIFFRNLDRIYEIRNRFPE